MFVVCGSRQSLKEDIWAGNYMCPACRTVQSHHLIRNRTVITAFFVPLAAITVQRGIICDRCRTFHVLPKAEYKNILGQQTVKFRAKEFPREVVLRDCDPKKVKIWLKWLLFILAVIFMLIMVIGMYQMISDIGSMDASVVYGIVSITAMGFVPLYFAVVSLLKALRKQAMYREITQKHPY